MKLVICGDAHFGAVFGLGGPNSKGGNTRVDDYRRTFSSIVDYCISNNVDVFIQTGDLFDSRDPSSDLIKIVDSEVKRLSDNNIASFIIMGNHDYKKTKDGYSSSLENLSCVDFPCSRVLIHPELIIVEKDFEKVGLILFPYRDKRLYGSSDCELASLKYNSHVKSIVDSADGCSKKIFVGHNFFYEGSYSDYGGSEILANQRKFGNIDLAVMGHLHEFRKVRDVPLSYYAGSMEKINFGDKNTKKFTIEYDTVRGVVTPIETKTKELFDGSLSVRNSDDVSSLNDKISKLNLDDKIVRLNIIVNELIASSINKQDIKKSLYSKGAYYVSDVKLSVKKVKRSRDLVLDTNEISDIKLFSKYLDSFSLTDEDKKKIKVIAKDIME